MTAVDDLERPRIASALRMTLWIALAAWTSHAHASAALAAY